MSEILKLINISKKYQASNGEVNAIEGINLSVNEGELISIVGPSGCGKSTLLSIISGLDTATYGEVYACGEKVTKVSPHIGYMLQTDNLLEWRSIYKNILLGLEIQHKLNKENINYVNILLKTYGLFEFKDKYPSQLSGGMRQRVALIRTLATKPDILLLDEAFSALDYQTRLAVTDDVFSILKKENKTTIMVSHDIPEAISMSDRIIVLTKRPANIKKIHELVFEEEAKTPMLRRNSKYFGEYFNLIWKELDVHV